MSQDYNATNYSIYILKDLYKSIDGLYAFTLYSRYRISPKELFLFIKRYTQNEFIIYTEEKLKLTEKGRTNILSELFYNKNKLGLESNLPENYKGGKIDIDVPYIPIINYLSNDLK